MSEESNQCKKRTQNEEENKVIGSVDQSISSNELDQPPTHMFKLIIDCFEHLFEWLSLQELLVFRRTCKRMHAVVNYYIKFNYPQLQSIAISEQQRWMDFCQTPLDYFKWINNLHIKELQLGRTEIDSITHILNQLHWLSLYKVKIDGDFYETVLKHCSRLNKLSIQECNYTSQTNIIGNGNDWLHRRYPTLEGFNIINGPASSSCPELLVFFERNSNIQTLSINSTLLLKNRELILESNLKFDQLLIFTDHDWNLNHSNFVTHLYARRFYNAVHIMDFNNPSFHGIQHLPTIPNLESLCLPYAKRGDFPLPIESMKTLYISVKSELFQMDIANLIQTKFINLHMITLYNVDNLDSVRPFVCQAPKVTSIHLQYVSGNDIEVKDLIALNEGRMKLTGACKIGISINEKQYLKLKWSGRTNFGMIEVKRS